MVHMASTGSLRPSAMETQCVYDSLSTDTYYGGLVWSTAVVMETGGCLGDGGSN